MHLPASHQELWRRIAGHRFDDRSATLTFTARLARENGWTVGRAVRVVHEYRRFAFLTTVAGHAVTPSEDVDQAWHLHLLYSRDYWDIFCGEVLRAPLHHGPTRGGALESVRYDAQYRATLSTYEHVFGSPPPPDIWPDAEQRFGTDLTCRRVNIARNWVIPKPFWLHHRTRTRGVAAIALPVPLIMAGLTNPLDLRGGDFLWLFGILAAAAVGSGYALRRLFLPAGTEGSVDLHPLEVALLANDGRYRFAAAALVALTTPDSTTDSAKLKEFPPEAADPLLGRLHERLAAVGDVDAMTMLRTAMETAAEEEEPRLRQMGLLTGAWWASSTPWLAVAPAVAVLGLGLAKIVVGLTREKPVGYLVM
ncbi:MAG: TIGR04222 domain-containing membrane protein, partial [Actinomycetota bacterium]